MDDCDSKILFIYKYICICVYIYIDRERVRERDREQVLWGWNSGNTVDGQNPAWP